MKSSYISMFLVALLAAVPAFAAETVVTGNVEAGLRLISGDNTDDEGSAKFNEYDTRTEGLIGRFSLFTAKDGNYLKASGNERGLEATAGRFDNFRVSLYFNEFHHNYTYDALTIYHGVGHDNLTLAGVGNNPANWLPFDYSVDRTQMGAKGEVTLGSPFFLTFDVNKTKKDGKMPWGVNSTSGNPGSYFTELPLPVEYTTNTGKVTLGYRTKTLSASIDGAISSFDNDNDFLRFQSANATLGNRPIVEVPVYLAPDNDMAQIGGQLVLRELPLSSTLALRGSYAKLQSDGDILGFGKFDGDVTYTTASVILRSRPIADLETEIAYRYTDKDNDSDQLDTGAGENELFHYTKHNIAVEGGYHLTAHNRIGAGYEFTKIDRAKEVRPDAEETKDNKVFIEWKNSSLDFLTAKLRYEYLDRDTDFPSAISPNDPASVTTLLSADDYSRPFDAATKHQDTVSVKFDVTPCSAFDMGIEYKYVKADYEDTVLGRTDEESSEVVVDGTAMLPMKATLYAYVAYEKSETTVNQRRGSEDPFGGVALNNTNFGWKNNREDDTWSYGAKLMVPMFNERLKLTAAWDYQKNDGEDTFSLGIFPTDATRPIDIDNNYGDYTKRTLDLRAEYAITENLDLILGYTYEKYELDDIQYDNYLYFYGAGASASYLSGAYADPDYEAKIGYVTMKYRF